MLSFIFTDVIFYKKKNFRENWLQLIHFYKSTQIILKFGLEHQTIRAFYTRGAFDIGKRNTDIPYAVSVFIYHSTKKNYNVQVTTAKKKHVLLS